MAEISAWSVKINNVEMGSIEEITEELNSQEGATLKIHNDAYNRTLVASDQDVDIKWGSTQIFWGRLKGSSYGTNELKPKVYNRVYSKLAKKIIDTGETVYTTVDQAMTAICAAAGVTKGSVPAQAISVKFIKCNCFDAVVYLAACSIKDYWASSGTTINIGDRGSAKGAMTIIGIGERGKDRQTKHNHVWVKGTDADGALIWGEAKSVGWTEGNDEPVVKVDSKSKDVPTLNNLAASFLREEELESSGVTVEFPIDEAYNLHPGDTVSTNREDLELDGTFKVWKVVKNKEKVSASLDKMQNQVDKELAKQSNLADLGIYEVQGGAALEPTTQSFQNLELLQYMDEGEGIYISDYSPNWRQGICYNVTWSAGPVSKVCTFAGTGYITSGIDIDLNGKSALTVSCWASPTANGADTNMIIYKSNNFMIQHYGTDNRIRVGVYVGGSWQYCTTDAAAAPLSARNHIVLRYTGSKLQIIINNKLAKEADVSGTFAASTSPLYTGAQSPGTKPFTGYIAVVIIYSRSLEDSEITDLYNYSKTTVPATLTSNDLDTQDLHAHFHCNEGTGDELTDAAGNAHVAKATGCEWYQGPVSKLLYLGSGDYIDCDHAPAAKIALSGLSTIAIGIWIDFESMAADVNYIFYKDQQVLLQQYGTNGAIRFGLYIGGSWTYCTTEDRLAQVGQRLFIMATYDGTNMKVFVNATERARTARTGSLPTNSNVFYMGAKNTTDGAVRGYMAEAMIWKRTLSTEEVIILYFFPLIRNYQISRWNLRIIVNEGGTTDPAPGVYSYAHDQSISVEAIPGDGYVFDFWIYDGDNGYFSNPEEFGPEAGGTTHTLIAIFRSSTAPPGTNQSGVATQLANTLTNYQILEEIKVLPPSSALIQTIAETMIVAKGSIIQTISEVLSISKNPPNWDLVVGLIPTGALGNISCNYSYGHNSVASGMSASVIFTESGYWAVKRVWVNGTDTAFTWGHLTATVSVGPYLGGLTEQVVCEGQYGWALSVSNSSDDGNDVVPGDMASKTYYCRTLQEEWDGQTPPHRLRHEVCDGAWLDGTQVTSSSSYAVPVQTAGTSHSLEFHIRWVNG